MQLLFTVCKDKKICRAPYHGGGGRVCEGIIQIECTFLFCKPLRFHNQSRFRKEAPFNKFYTMQYTVYIHSIFNILINVIEYYRYVH